MAKKQNTTVDVTEKLSNDELTNGVECLLSALHEDHAEIERITNDIRLLQAKIKAMPLNRKEGTVYVSNEDKENSYQLGYNFGKKHFYVQGAWAPFSPQPLLACSKKVRREAHAYCLPLLMEELRKDYLARKEASE